MSLNQQRKRIHTILTVFGTRPEVIKLAPVLRQIDLFPQEFRSINVCSGQHTDLLKPFVKSFNVRVDRDLGVMRPGQSLNALMSRVIWELDPILEAEKPDLLLVQGDTTTTAGAAMAAFHRHIAIGHVEAGLRTGDPTSPFPEEMNRRLVSRIATLHFAATQSNRENLISEGIEDSKIIVTGNPVVDALNQIGTTLTPSSKLTQLLDQTKQFKRITLTTHRRENFSGAIEANLRVLKRFAMENEDVAIIFPVHPNPVVRQAARDVLGNSSRIWLIDPLDYPDFISLLSNSWLIVSDSGGIQEEAPSLGKPLIVLRDKTERPEAIDAGIAKLAPTPEVFELHLQEMKENKSWGDQIGVNPFGNGDASQRIVHAIRQWFRVKTPTPVGAMS